MEQIIKDIENEQLQQDRINVNKWTAERFKMQKDKELKDRLYKLFLDYLDDKETAIYNFSELEMLRKFYNYLDKRL